MKTKTPSKLARNGDVVNFNWSTVGPGSLYLEPGAFFDASFDDSRETLTEAIYGAWDRGFRLYSVSNAGAKADQRTVSFEELPDLETVEQWEVYGPIARLLGQREHGSLEAFKEAYLLAPEPKSGGIAALAEHIKVLRAFVSVLLSETHTSFEWQVVPRFGFDLRLASSGHIVQSLLCVQVLEVDPNESGGSVTVNQTDMWDPCGPTFERRRFRDTQELQKLLVEVLGNPAFRRNLCTLTELAKVNP